jgi:hypothetical protein
MCSDRRGIRRSRPWTQLFALGIVLAAPMCAQQSIGGCQVLPVENIWNTPVANLPLHPNSANYIEHIGTADLMHPDFEVVDVSSLELDPDSGETPHLWSDGFDAGSTARWSAALP